MRTATRPSTRALAALGALITALLVACGGGEPAADGSPDTTAAPSPTGTATAAFPVTVPSGDGEITVEDRPERIVSLSPTATEVLYAVGAGGQVVAVDDQSTYPPEAPTTDLSGLEPNVEAILGYEPDLVLAGSDPGGLVDGLAEADVPTLLLPAVQELEQAYTQIERVGAATGHVGSAAEVVSSMQSEMEQIVASVPDFEQPPTYYHELDENFFSVTNATFVGDVYGRLGLTSITESRDLESAYPQLSPEFVIEADPDLIFLADAQCCGVTPESVAQRPGWGEISAVANDNVFTVDADLASRWGPRIVDYARSIAEHVQQLPRPTPTG